MLLQGTQGQSLSECQDLGIFDIYFHILLDKIVEINTLLKNQSYCDYGSSWPQSAYKNLVLGMGILIKIFPSQLLSLNCLMHIADSQKIGIVPFFFASYFEILGTCYSVFLKSSEHNHATRTTSWAKLGLQKKESKQRRKHTACGWIYRTRCCLYLQFAKSLIIPIMPS